MSRGSTRAVLAFAALLAACKGPSVPNPAQNETRYTCCNIHYEKDEISDANYLKGTLIPFGTRVQILDVRRSSVKFQATGHPPITLVMKYDKTSTIDQVLDRWFPRDDPHTKLAATREAPRKAPAKGKKGAPAHEGSASGGSSQVQKAIEQGTVETGMTRDQVIMSLGYPPAHRTPSLENPSWTYWQNRWVTMEVYFDGDKVSRVQR
jgi:hypothetical protein